MGDQSEVLRRQYAARFAGTAEYRKKVWRVLCTDFFSRYVPETSRVLDLGAGWGEFINAIPAAEKFAMDLNPATRDNLDNGVKCINQDCSQEWPLEPDSLDVVFTSNFLEHLQDKASIERSIAEANRCLVDGGLLICMGPNIKAAPGSYWDFWDHQIPLTELSCAELLEMQGFKIETCLPRFLPYSMSAGTTPPLLLLRLYLRIPLLWPIFGKQFLVIGSKCKNKMNGDEK